MRGLLPALLALVACGCNATGGEQGGQPLAPDPCDATQGGHTWTDLYTCYFGPAGKAGCSAQSACHSGTSSMGTAISGFACGASKDACWFSMTHHLYVLQDVEPLELCDAGAAEADGSCPTPPADAGADAAPICSCFTNPYSPLVPLGGTSDPTTTNLWATLHSASSSCTSPTCNNMPCGNLGQNCLNGTGAYTFTSDDLARISAWIKEGAQDN
jgi:hypothetical protein